MFRRIIVGSTIGLLMLAIALPTATAAAAVKSDFTGLWVSTDTDGSSQTLSVSAGARPSVVYQDFYASGCDQFAGPATHWVASGFGSVEDDTLYVEFHKSGCGTFLQGGYVDAYTYDSGTDTLTDSFGITWYRA
jgi:hypothetical protein